MCASLKFGKVLAGFAGILLLLITGCTVPVPIEVEGQLTGELAEIPIAEFLWVNPPAPEYLFHNIEQAEVRGEPGKEITLEWLDNRQLLDHEIYLVEVTFVSAGESLSFWIETVDPFVQFRISENLCVDVYWRVSTRHIKLRKAWNLSQVDSLQVPCSLLEAALLQPPFFVI